MSAHQKHPKPPSRHNSRNEDSHPDYKRNSDSRQSYLKAFKKYYIEKLLEKKIADKPAPLPDNNKENFYFHDSQIDTHRCSQKQPHKNSKHSDKMKLSIMTDITRHSREQPKLNPTKIASVVANNDCELEQVLYNSISQIQQEMMSFGDLNDLARENKLLKASLAKLKLILKDKLALALQKNKEQLIIMFEEYSNMIRKLLEDKETLTDQLEACKLKLTQEQQHAHAIEQQCENKIRIIVEDNAHQIDTTKQQIEQFLQMIVQYEEEAGLEKQELDRLREKVVELEIQNDTIKNNQQGQGGTQSLEMGSRGDQFEDRYAQKIEALLALLEQLQDQNTQLNHFLKSCKCSRIKSKNQSEADIREESEPVAAVVAKYERRLLQAQREAVGDEMMLREALKKKDECIDRLNLIIEELRKVRYASVDKEMEEALMRNIEK